MKYQGIRRIIAFLLRAVMALGCVYAAAPAEPVSMPEPSSSDHSGHGGNIQLPIAP